MDRPDELQLLAIAVVIGLAQFGWATAAARREQDPKWAVGPQDTKAPLGLFAGRLDRAYKNFLETFPLFAAALVVAVLMGKTGAVTFWGSVIYVVARAVYVPLYAFGVPVVRSIVWMVGAAGMLMVVAAPFT